MSQQNVEAFAEGLPGPRRGDRVLPPSAGRGRVSRRRGRARHGAPAGTSRGENDEDRGDQGLVPGLGVRSRRPCRAVPRVRVAARTPSRPWGWRSSGQVPVSGVRSRSARARHERIHGNAGVPPHLGLACASDDQQECKTRRRPRLLSHACTRPDLCSTWAPSRVRSAIGPPVGPTLSVRERSRALQTAGKRS